jgi:quercetin dioxygenase-like cupin family protein
VAARNTGRCIVRRFSAPLSAVAIVLFGLATMGGLSTAAQEATPAAGPNVVVGQLAPRGESFEAFPGVDIEFINEGKPATASGQSLVLWRVTLTDGGEIPSHMHPGTTILTVESGSLSWTLLAGTVQVARPGAALEQVTEAGTEIILDPGASLFYDADVVHSARSVASVPAIVLLASLFETGQPFIAWTEAPATPTSEQGTPTA